MPSDKTKPSEDTGCLLAAWHLLVTGPLYMVLLYGILDRIKAETWLWVVFWSYVPASILSLILAEFVKALHRRGE